MGTILDKAFDSDDERFKKHTDIQLCANIIKTIEHKANDGLWKLNNVHHLNRIDIIKSTILDLNILINQLNSLLK